MTDIYLLFNDFNEGDTLRDATAATPPSNLGSCPYGIATANKSSYFGGKFCA